MKTSKETAALAAFSLLALVAAPKKAFCWGDVGHQIVGEVADELIAPDTRSWIRGIIGIEPVAVAANWPDHVRDDDRFGGLDDAHDFAPYHFCEVPTGYTYANEPKHDKKDCYGVVMNAAAILRNPAAKREEKMIALRYLVHVVGDIHQPLHVGNGYDRGGNSCTIRWQPKPGGAEQKVNLHTFWDSTIIDYLGASYADPKAKRGAARWYPEYVNVLKHKYPDMFAAEARRKYGEAPVLAWLAESQELRESGVYPDDPNAMKDVKKGEEYKNRPYCAWYVDQDKDKVPAGAADPSKFPLVGKEYADHFVPIVELQLLKGGVRLAVLLDQLAQSAKGSGGGGGGRGPHASQEQIIKDVQDAFEKPALPAAAN